MENRKVREVTSRAVEVGGGKPVQNTGVWARAADTPPHLLQAALPLLS